MFSYRGVVLPYRGVVHEKHGRARGRGRVRFRARATATARANARATARARARTRARDRARAREGPKLLLLDLWKVSKISKSGILGSGSCGPQFRCVYIYIYTIRNVCFLCVRWCYLQTARC